MQSSTPAKPTVTSTATAKQGFSLLGCLAINGLAMSLATGMAFLGMEIGKLFGERSAAKESDAVNSGFSDRAIDSLRIYCNDTLSAHNFFAPVDCFSSNYACINEKCDYNSFAQKYTCGGAYYGSSCSTDFNTQTCNTVDGNFWQYCGNNPSSLTFTMNGFSTITESLQTCNATTWADYTQACENSTTTLTIDLAIFGCILAMAVATAAIITLYTCYYCCNNKKPDNASKPSESGMFSGSATTQGQPLLDATAPQSEMTSVQTVAVPPAAASPTPA